MVIFSSGLIFLLPNLVMMSREHNDRPVQDKKSRVELKELMRNIPNEGARTKAILKAK